MTAASSANPILQPFVGSHCIIALGHPTHEPLFAKAPEYKEPNLVRVFPTATVIEPLHIPHANDALLLLSENVSVNEAAQPLISVGQFRHAQHVSSIARVPFISTSLPSIIESCDIKSAGGR